ncbi:hypothetical protein AGMMS49991_00830 [Spirochaetia bacterium]|nr:hypothetical protein AGMMS49991_00830 [Spirochaetia bacterium]
MVVRRVFPLFLILFLLGPFFSLTAQENDNPNEIPAEPDWNGALPELYARGDKIFALSAGVLFPVLFLDGQGEVRTSNITVGGAFSLAFNYFFTTHLYVGGEIGFTFAGTKNNMVYIVPIGARVGYQFLLGRFEFPLSLMIGFAPQTYLKKNYLGLFIKPQASAYWRVNSDWSFGLNLGWWWVPEWPIDHNDRYGNFIELTLSARYHL